MTEQSGYPTYLRYKKTIELLTKKECTVKELTDEINCSSSTICRMLDALMSDDIAKVVRFNFTTGQNQKVYRIKNPGVDLK